MHRRNWEKQVLKAATGNLNKWTYRAIVLAAVLEYIGYNTESVMQADKDALVDTISLSADQIITRFQMREPGTLPPADPRLIQYLEGDPE